MFKEYSVLKERKLLFFLIILIMLFISYSFDYIHIHIRFWNFREIFFWSSFRIPPSLKLEPLLFITYMCVCRTVINDMMLSITFLIIFLSRLPINMSRSSDVKEWWIAKKRRGYFVRASQKKKKKKKEFCT